MLRGCSRYQFDSVPIRVAQQEVPFSPDTEIVESPSHNQQQRDAKPGVQEAQHCRTGDTQPTSRWKPHSQDSSRDQSRCDGQHGLALLGVTLTLGASHLLRLGLMCHRLDSYLPKRPSRNMLMPTAVIHISLDQS